VKKGFILVALLAVVACAWAQGKEKDKGTSRKPAATGSKVADAGSFGIFVRGKRVGTETFRIEEGPEVSVATSEIKVDDSSGKAEQTSEMRVARDGDLRLYRWRSTVPTKEETVVEPKDDLLMEHIIPADQKKIDLPHILPLSTSILDDNFFSHREILAWRYLATSCIDQGGRRACSRGVFGILVPRQHMAGNATVELVGRNVIKVKGVERELNELKVDSGGGLWLIWIDDNLKVIKMAVPSDGVEIVRD
jgi:hypothetical protein